ncbi:bifunctional P-450:NADPH-P450 reductase [Histoplasma ohiense]|nr:bifunctional P-450:NADPH-P450 reductase [Histoplasma ohiense (nom. inval.)]
MTTPIPGPPGVPLLGNIFDINPKDTWGSLKSLADKYGEIYKVNALGHQIVFIGSAALLEEICDETRFRKCVTGPVVEIRRAVHDSLFTAYHHEKSWDVAHRIMAPQVSPSAAEAMFTQMVECAATLVSRWTSDPGQRIDVTSDLQRSDLQSVLACYFNQSANYFGGPEPSMIAAMQNSTLEAMKRPNRPKLLTRLLYQRKFDKDIRTMRSFAAEIIANRKSESAPKSDMLNALLNNPDPETGEVLGEERVIDEIITIFIGSATAPCLVSFAVYYLLQNPEEIIKARDEIDSILGANGEITSSNLSSFAYCEAILREAFRLSAVAPAFNIEPIPSDEPGEVQLAGGKYQISRKQPMIAVLSAVNRDPAVFDEPEAFKPERMLGEAYDKLPSGVKKGFGNGKRRCFGKVPAWQWCLITLISILRKVDLTLANKDYKLASNGAFCVRPLEFFALAGPRER